MVTARENPFRTEKIQQLRYELDGGEWRTFLAGLGQLQYRAAVAGPRGSGKTTLLEDLRERLEDLGFSCIFLQINESNRKLVQPFLRQRLHLSPAGKSILLLDGAEQLRCWQWWFVRGMTRRWRGLIITTHQHGKLPTVRQCQTYPELFARIVRQLDPERKYSACELTAVYHRHQGNLREALRELYDIHSRTSSSTAATSPHGGTLSSGASSDVRSCEPEFSR